jgi:hypothetical protein
MAKQEYTRTQMRLLMEACQPQGTPTSRWQENTARKLIAGRMIGTRWRDAIDRAAPRGTRVSVYVIEPAGVQYLAAPRVPKKKSATAITKAELGSIVNLLRTVLTNVRHVVMLPELRVEIEKALKASEVVKCK